MSNCILLPFLEFAVCSQPQVHTISIGDNVSSVCELNSSFINENAVLRVSYCTNGDNCQNANTTGTDACYQLPSMNFTLLVTRNNNNERALSANIYIFNVTGKFSLNVHCTASTQYEDSMSQQTIFRVVVMQSESEL